MVDEGWIAMEEEINIIRTDVGGTSVNLLLVRPSSIYSIKSGVHVEA